VDFDAVDDRKSFKAEWERVIGPLSSTGAESPTTNELKTPRQPGNPRPSYNEVNALTIERLEKLQLS
jgi:hypothetical protein